MVTCLENILILIFWLTRIGIPHTTGRNWGIKYKCSSAETTTVCSIRRRKIPKTTFVSSRWYFADHWGWDRSQVSIAHCVPKGIKANVSYNHTKAYCFHVDSNISVRVLKNHNKRCWQHQRAFKKFKQFQHGILFNSNNFTLCSIFAGLQLSISPWYTL